MQTEVELHLVGGEVDVLMLLIAKWNHGRFLMSDVSALSLICY